MANSPEMTPVKYQVLLKSEFGQETQTYCIELLNCSDSDEQKWFLHDHDRFFIRPRRQRVGYARYRSNFKSANGFKSAQDALQALKKDREVFRIALEKHKKKHGF